jgi:biopolymer transport protein ExbB/TolQ
MRFCTRLFVGVLVVSGLMAGAAKPALSQQKEHAVSTQDLRKDVQKASDERRANEAAIRELLSTEQGQKALKSTGADFQQVNKAVSQLSDEEAARMAAQSRVVQKDIAAGNFSDRDILIVILCVAALVLIIVAVR